jgi:hypothetical protein
VGALAARAQSRASDAAAARKYLALTHLDPAVRRGGAAAANDAVARLAQLEPGLVSQLFAGHASIGDPNLADAICDRKAPRRRKRERRRHSARPWRHGQRRFAPRDLCTLPGLPGPLEARQSALDRRPADNYRRFAPTAS